MARHIFSVLCQRGIVDQGKNTLSMIDVLEEGSVTMPKSDYEKLQQQEEEQIGEGVSINLGFNFTVVSLWARENSDVAEEKEQYKIDIIPPKKKAIKQVESHYDLSSAHYARTIMSISSIPFVGDGEYLFSVKSFNKNRNRWEVKCKLPFLLTINVKDEK